MQNIAPLIGVLVAAFLLGSVPWGLVISKVFYGKDLREEGSGNIGTTNAIRSMGKVGGYAVFVLDFGKGLLSGFIALWISQAVGYDTASATPKYVSVGSMASALACPLLALWVYWGNWPAWIICSIAGLTVFWAHRGNLARLREGTERKLGH
jgi:glycerol-3-phosphate acyltransferase PlsY